jgi:hypothetical protein
MKDHGGDQQLQIAATLAVGDPDGVAPHPQGMGQVMRPIAGLGVKFSQKPCGKLFVWLERGCNGHARCVPIFPFSNIKLADVVDFPPGRSV